MPDKQRLFFGMEIYAPWPAAWPEGRMLEEVNRHVTLAFLGSVLLDEITHILRAFPSPPFLLGPCGLFDQCLFLPKESPRAAAWHIVWQEPAILSFQEELARWLRENGFAISLKPWFPHATICRRPFEMAKWRESFEKLPCYAGSIHLYEHMGSLQYRSHWSWPLLSPFEEVEHVADVAFYVYGADVEQLYLHAFWALCFKHPALLQYFQEPRELRSLEEMVIHLNEAVSLADRASGCPFKAVSFHGNIEPFQQNLLRWEMIVDV